MCVCAGVWVDGWAGWVGGLIAYSDVHISLTNSNLTQLYAHYSIYPGSYQDSYQDSYAGYESTG